MKANKLKWMRYEVEVTLVPCSPSRPNGTITQKCLVVGLNDQMAGLLACKNAEDYHPGYSALMYETKKKEDL